MKMRPEVLFPLFAPATRIKGVGARLAPMVERIAGGGRVIDLLWHLPHAVIDRRLLPAIAAAAPGKAATLRLSVVAHAPPAGPRSPYRVHMRDESGQALDLVFFNPHRDYLTRVLPVGATRLVSGTVDYFAGQPQIAHPDYILAPEQASAMPAFEPVYPLTQGLSNKRLRQWIATALGMAPELAEWIDAGVLAREGWPAWRAALAQAHCPLGAQAADPGQPARRRLAYDELFANQLALA
ncbi:MAG: ATP-dependent DNA helicase RecG, partial [Alphaproteobacteria bacterium]